MKALKLGLLLTIATNLTACATARAPVSGALYTDVRSGDMVTDAHGGTAQGQACATSILGLIATGDASVDAAKKNGGVLQVVSVDHSSSSILGIYAKYCTIVQGKKGQSGQAQNGAPDRKLSSK